MQSNDPPLSLSTVGQIAITVRDLDAAVSFYRDTLGMRFLMQAPPGMAFFDLGGVRLLLGVAQQGQEIHPASILYYRVDDIAAASAALEARGVSFLREPHLVHRAEDHDLWLAFFHDMEENVLALMSEVPRE